MAVANRPQKLNLVALERALDFFDSLIEYRLPKEGPPGAIVTVSLKGSVIFSKGYGFANVERKVRMTPEHIFRVASHSKMFTATLIMMFAEQRHLNLNAAVSDYLPWLRKVKDRGLRTVTLRQVLSHGAGITRDGDEGDFWNLFAPFPNHAMLQKEFETSKVLLKPGKEMKYSNHGYGLLGLVLESITGDSFAKLLEDRIFKPLQLNDSGLEHPNHILSRAVTGYSRADSELPQKPIRPIDTAALAAATGVYSTGTDICNFLWAHTSSGNRMPLSESSKQRMQRTVFKAAQLPGRVEYGLGFIIEHLGKRRLFGHSGGFAGQNTYSMIDPRQGLAVSVFTNSIQRKAGPILRGLINTVDFFQKNLKREPKSKAKFSGRFSSLWFTLDIVPLGGKRVVSVSPAAGWDVFSGHLEELTVTDGNTLKIIKTDSFGNKGEIITFVRGHNGSTKYIRYSSLIAVPHEDYRKWLLKQRIVSNGPPIKRAIG